MALLMQPLKSLRPQSTTLCQGLGNGSGSSLSGLFKMGTAAANMFDYRARTDGATGTDARILYARLHQYGTGGGEAVRAYAFSNNASAATGGTLNGIHASLSIAASCGISGQGYAARLTLEAASATRTLPANIAALNLDSNIGASNTVAATTAFVKVTNTGSVTIGKLFNLPTVASAGLLAAHTTDAITHSIRCVDAAGTVFYIMCTTTSSNRTGGA